MDSVAFKVRNKIKNIPKGRIFTPKNFLQLGGKKAIVQVLNRLQREGNIERISKGKYYVPRQTKFGFLGPSEYFIVQSLLEGDKSGYLSGIALYNQLGLTTQLSNEITIVGKRYNRRVSVGKLNVKYIKRKTPVRKKENVYILQLLDAISDIKRIPDTSTNDILRILKSRIQPLSLSDKRELIRVSQFYRPFVMALVGGILDEDGIKEVEKLRDSINPLTTFKLGISEKVLPLKKNWNLV